MVEAGTVDLGTIKLGVRRWGDVQAPVMILVHGLGGDALTWDAVGDHFADDWQVIAVTMRGHPGSDRTGEYSFQLMRDDLAAFLESEGIADAVIIGHSMGGMVGLLLAQSHPALVAKLILEETAPPYPQDRPPLDPPDEEPPYDFAMVNAIRAQLCAPDPAVSAGLSKITAPTLIIGGGPKSQIDQDLYTVIQAAIPDSKLITIDVGHSIHAEDHEEFCRAVESFLE